MSRNQAFSKIRKSGNLPTLPEILFRLLEACDNDEVALPDIAAIISKDPALSVKVLQLVNSAYYGFRHTFTSIEQTVIYLGANTIKNLAITTSIHQVFRDKKYQNLNSFNMGVFWWHSLLCATIAKRISVHTQECNQDEAYLSALLHDFGKILMVATFPRQYAEVLKEADDNSGTIHLENELIGINHCEVGAWLIRHWKLNPLIADAVAYHHESSDQVGEAFTLVKIVYLSNLIAKNLLEFEEIEKTGQNLLNIEPEDLQGLLNGARQEVEEIAAEMQIRVVPLTIQKTFDDDKCFEESISDLISSEDSEESSEESEEREEEDGAHLEKAIISRVKNVSLLTTLLEKLIKAGEIEEILKAFEQSINILVNVDKVLFFCPDADGLLLRAQTSKLNPLSATSKGLTLPSRKSTSLIAKTFESMQMAGLLARTEQQGNIADQQILTVLDCPRAMPIPLKVKDTAVGVVVLGLAEDQNVLLEEETRLIATIAQQVAQSIHLENTKVRRKAELHAERNAAISMAAKKLAHEINNPLGIISNYLLTMKMKLPGESEVVGELNIIDEEIQRISSMVNQMEMYSQAPFEHFQVLDLNEIIRDIIHLSQTSLFANPGVSLSFIPAGNLPAIKSSKDAIKQILINLLKNSAEAMTQGGRAIVRTQSQPPEEESGGGIIITVADTGPGIPESVLKNLYQPFVTTKQNGNSGLGMSIIKKAVDEIGGKLYCSSSAEDGTTFTIHLPALATESLNI